MRGEEAKLAEMQENIKDELSVFRDRMEGLKKELEPFETKLNVLEAENAEITDEKQELAKVGKGRQRGSILNILFIETYICTLSIFAIFSGEDQH